MTNKYAVIEAGKVINTAIATPEFASSQGWIDASDGVEIGWLYDNGKFSPPPRNIDAEWANIRQERDRRLIVSDNFVLPDRWASMTPEKQQAWSVYRQALRDIPQTFSDPKDVVWPTKPE